MNPLIDEIWLNKKTGKAVIITNIGRKAGVVSKSNSFVVFKDAYNIVFESYVDIFCENYTLYTEKSKAGNFKRISIIEEISQKVEKL